MTFRSFDSLPQSVLRSWRFERENIVRVAAKMKRPLSAHEQTRLRELYSEKIETYLDAGYGSCHMRDERIGSMVAKSIQFFDGVRYVLAAWCVMPNHVHAVVKPLLGFDLDAILHSWKAFTAREANKILVRCGAFWQSEGFDHLIRDKQEFEHAIRYVLQNPVKAGLTNWKWTGGGKGFPEVWPGNKEE